jgi:hypothetical protein
MPSEREWVDTFIEELQKRMQSVSLKGSTVRVEAGKKLPYAFEVLSYSDTEPDEQCTSQYQTDVLIYDQFKDETWIPRVVIECKQKTVTTHDALTYSTKAATHKNVHPYLRYGILLGKRNHYPLPGRLIRHGLNFDFMASWVDYEPTNDEWQDLMGVLVEEVQASRLLQETLTESRSKSRKHFSLIHRPLTFKKML